MPTAKKTRALTPAAAVAHVSRTTYQHYVFRELTKEQEIGYLSAHLPLLNLVTVCRYHNRKLYIAGRLRYRNVPEASIAPVMFTAATSAAAGDYISRRI